MNNDISESNYNNYAADHNSIRCKSAFIRLYTLACLSGVCLGGNLCQIYYIRRPIT